MSEHVRDRLGEFLVGALDEAESARVASHLEECAACGEELALLHSLAESLPSVRKRRAWPFAAAALAAAACLALLLFRWSAPPAPRGPVQHTGPLALAGSRIEALPEARLDIASGREVALLAGKAQFTVVPAAEPFRVRTPRGTAVVLGTTFSIEVEEPMNAKVPTAAAVVTITVVSGAILWKSLDQGVPDTRVQAGQQAVARLGSVELKAAPAPATTAAPVMKAPEVAKLEEEKKALEQKNSVLEAKLAEATKKNEELERAVAVGAAKSSAPAGPAPAKIRFGPASRLESLAKVDWREAGEAARALGPALKELISKKVAGEKLSPELVEKVNIENAKLVKVALAVAQHLPTYGGANGAYTHPLVLANVMANHLDAAGVPLDDGQIAQMNQIGEEFEQRWQALDASFTADTLLTEKLLGELELKKVYIGRLDAVLSAQQAAVLFEADTKDVMSMDLYSPVLMTAQWARPVVKSTPEALARVVAKTWLDEWDLGDKNVDALATAFVSEVASQPVTSGSYKLDDAIVALRGSIKAMKDALRTLALDADAAKGLRNEGAFVIPRLVPDTRPAK